MIPSVTSCNNATNSGFIFHNVSFAALSLGTMGIKTMPARTTMATMDQRHGKTRWIEVRREEEARAWFKQHHVRKQLGCGQTPLQCCSIPPLSHLPMSKHHHSPRHGTSMSGPGRLPRQMCCSLWCPNDLSWASRYDQAMHDQTAIDIRLWYFPHSPPFAHSVRHWAV